MYEDRAQTIRTINELQIQKTMIALAASLDRRRVGDFVTFQPLSEESCTRIKEVVSKIAFVWETFMPFKIPLNSPEELAFMHQSAEIVLQNRNKETSAA
jgi:hypothetical protein